MHKQNLFIFRSLSSSLLVWVELSERNNLARPSSVLCAACTMKSNYITYIKLDTLKTDWLFFIAARLLIHIAPTRNKTTKLKGGGGGWTLSHYRRTPKTSEFSISIVFRWKTIWHTFNVKLIFYLFCRLLLRLKLFFFVYIIWEVC